VLHPCTRRGRGALLQGSQFELQVRQGKLTPTAFCTCASRQLARIGAGERHAGANARLATATRCIMVWVHGESWFSVQHQTQRSGSSGGDMGRYGGHREGVRRGRTRREPLSLIYRILLTYKLNLYGCRL
jgi:hypothetical protein